MGRGSILVLCFNWSKLKMTAHLVLGDGNFSFSLSLCRRLAGAAAGKLKAVKVVATSLESLERVLQRPGAGECLEKLREYPSVMTLHSVDATKLEEFESLNGLGLKFDVVVFNFPHTGGKGKIEQNRALLRDFFISASKSSLLASTGELHVSLCRGQGGTPVDPPDRGFCNSWKVVEMAAEGGFVLDRVEPFLSQHYPDYTPTGYRGHTDKPFSTEGALRHVFRAPLATQGSLYAPWYQHDISFWCIRNTFSEDSFKSLVKRLAEGKVLNVRCVDTYDPTPGAERVGYCYRVTYGSYWDAVGRREVARLQQLLRRATEEEIVAELR